MKKLLLSIFYLCICSICFGLNLESIPQPQRDSILKQLAKTTVLLYGPDYYRNGETVIKQENADSDTELSLIIDSKRDDIIKRNSSTYYSVTTLYDQTKELFYEKYVSKVYIWAVDPMPFNVLFGNQSGYGLDETLGKKIRDISDQFGANANPSDISNEGKKLGIKTMNYKTVPLEKLTQVLKYRKDRDSSSVNYNRKKRLELEQYIVSGPTFDNKLWMKSFKAEKKCILDTIKKNPDLFERLLSSDIKDLNRISSTENSHFNTIKHSNKLHKIVVIPIFVINEKDLSGIQDISKITSMMHLKTNNISVFIGNNKNIFYGCSFIKMNDKWEKHSLNSILLSLSNKLIQSGLNSSRQKAEVMVLQQDGKVKNLIFFQKGKKATFLDARNYLNDYQTSFPNIP